MNGAPKITYDFVMGQLRIAMVAVLAYGGGRGWWTPQDATLLTALGASLGPVAVPWVWSIVTNLSTVHVASGSAAAIVAKVERLNPIEAGQAAVRVAVDTGTKIAAVLLLAVMLFPSDASAQTPLPAKRAAATLATGSFLNTIKQWVATDIDGAITLSTSIPDLQDPIGQKCWQTFKGIGEVISAHPLPVTLRLATDVQAARLIAMSLKKVCTEPACSQVWTDMQNQVQALAPIGVPFTLQSICSKVL